MTEYRNMMTVQAVVMERKRRYVRYLKKVSALVVTGATMTTDV